MKIANAGSVVMSFSADKIKKDRLTYGIPVDTMWNDKPMEHFDGLEVVFKVDDNRELIDPGMMKYRGNLRRNRHQLYQSQSNDFPCIILKIF